MSELPLLTLSSMQFAFYLIIPTLVFLCVWRIHPKRSVHAIIRMTLQLWLVGFILTFLLNPTLSYPIVLLVFLFMLVAAAWISIKSIPPLHQNRMVFSYIFLSIGIGGGLSLVVITQLVLELTPWYTPRFMIPLAGMMFSNTMVSVSLSAERISEEIKSKSFTKARGLAITASLIPTINALFATGIVALPGIMTGQILAGTPPLVAVRYQVVIMLAIFGSAGLGSILFLLFSKKYFSAPAMKILTF